MRVLCAVCHCEQPSSDSPPLYTYLACKLDALPTYKCRNRAWLYYFKYLHEFPSLLPPPFSFFLPPARLQDDEHGILSRCLAKGGCRRYALVELRRMRMLYISIMQSPRVQLHPPHLMVKVKGEV